MWKLVFGQKPEKKTLNRNQHLFLSMCQYGYTKIINFTTTSKNSYLPKKAIKS
jgi:hypothetical protein